MTHGGSEHDLPNCPFCRGPIAGVALLQRRGRPPRMPGPTAGGFPFSCPACTRPVEMGADMGAPDGGPSF